MSIEDDHVIQEMEVEEAVERFDISLLDEVSDSEEELEEEVLTLPEDEDCLITKIPRLRSCSSVFKRTPYARRCLRVTFAT